MVIPDDELKKKYPHLEKFWPYTEVINNESPRGKVLVSTGFLEEQLKEVLLAFMLENKDAEELVEGGNAPLGTLSSRITARARTTCSRRMLGIVSAELKPYSVCDSIVPPLSSSQCMPGTMGHNSGQQVFLLPAMGPRTEKGLAVHPRGVTRRAR